MRKNQKGIALAYTLMMMILVFSICMVITTIMLSQITYSNTYADRSETERICSQIGEIFYGVGGDYTKEENDSPFEAALKTAGFEVASSQDEWTIKSDKKTFVLTLSTQEGINRLKITNAQKSRIYLVVAVSTNEQGTHIIEWTKGND